MARSIGDDKAPLGICKKPVGDVDRNFHTAAAEEAGKPHAIKVFQDRLSKSLANQAGQNLSKLSEISRGGIW